MKKKTAGQPVAKPLLRKWLLKQHKYVALARDGVRQAGARDDVRQAGARDGVRQAVKRLGQHKSSLTRNSAVSGMSF